jgi:hypothetical protein
MITMKKFPNIPEPDVCGRGEGPGPVGAGAGFVAGLPSGGSTLVCMTKVFSADSLLRKVYDKLQNL